MPGDADGFSQLQWSWRGTPIRVGCDWIGEGPTLLMLPALSSISTRQEMAPLARSLSARWRCVSADWPGFGDLVRPRLDWSPEILSAFLARLMGEVRPQAIVAAGHAATYVLHHAARHGGPPQHLVLAAPTWRGPLPTMMGGQRPWFATIRSALDLPVAGPALYAANVSAPVIAKMAREHVYADPGWLTPERLAAKRAVTRGSGARHASVRFVTGALDRVASRSDFLALAGAAKRPMLVIVGAGTPRKSKAEMEALAGIAGVEVLSWPRGRLALHEEFAGELAAPIDSFLAPLAGDRSPGT